MAARTVVGEVSPRALRLDVVLVTVGIVLAVREVAFLAVPDLDATVVAPSLDLVLDTVATLVALAVAALAWVRYRERDETVALFQSAAFLVLAMANGAIVLLAVPGLMGKLGATVPSPGQSPLYVFMLARMLAAGLLVIGALGAQRQRRLGHPGRVLAGSVAAWLVIVGLVAAPAGLLPVLATGADSFSLTPLGVGGWIIVAGLYAWAAALSRALYRRDGAIGDAYLAVGLVIAGFAQLASVTDPGIFTGLVTAGDILRLAFDVVLLLGIQAQMHASLGELRDVNADLTRLGAVELERATQGERARLSRELHDGLAQNLWLAKLKAGRLAAVPGLAPEAAALTEELAEAIEAGLVEAQQAVAALRVSSDGSSRLHELLAQTVDDFADRFGLRVEFECQSELPALSSRAHVEALRITQEALTNVRRHADATLVRVRAYVEAGQLVVVVGDNGRGFDPAAIGNSAFGLAGMRERAALLGGELYVASAPKNGTMVSLVVPLSLVPPAEMGGAS